MSTAALSSQQIEDKILALLTRNRYRCSEEDWEVIGEALRRVKEHERLVRDVLPDLRNRLTKLQAGAYREDGG